MEYQDKNLTCKDCGSEFAFTASEQEFYANKGFQNEPSRCPTCRTTFKQQRRENRQMYDATCAQCGAATQVPFQPTQGRPVYCMDCFRAKNPS